MDEFPFSVEDVRARAGDKVFDRARPYMPFVMDVHIEEHGANASVRGTSLYEVDLLWEDDGTLDGACSCPHGEAGHFCKHQCALALVLLKHGQSVDSGTPSLPRELLDTSELAKKLIQSVDQQLLQHYSKMAAALPPVGQLFATAWSFNFGSPEQSAALVQQAYSRIFLCYGKPSWVDLAANRHEIVSLGLQMKMLITVGLTDGLEQICHNALADFKRLVFDDPHDDAREWADHLQTVFEVMLVWIWMATMPEKEAGRKTAHYFVENYEWREASARDIIPILGEEATAAYRDYLIECRHEKIQVESAENSLLRDLALCQDDIPLLRMCATQGDRFAYSMFFNDLQAIDRPDLAADVVAHAHQAHAISTDAPQGYSPFFIPVREAVQCCLTAKRIRTALAIARTAFTSTPSVEFQNLLLTCGRQAHKRSLVLQQVIEWIAQQPWTNADTPIDLALAEGDGERAWEYANRWGVNDRWMMLALSKDQPRPCEAIRLAVERIERDKWSLEENSPQPVLKLLCTYARQWQHDHPDQPIMQTLSQQLRYYYGTDEMVRSDHAEDGEDKYHEDGFC